MVSIYPILKFLLHVMHTHTWHIIFEFLWDSHYFLFQMSSHFVNYCICNVCYLTIDVVFHCQYYGSRILYTSKRNNAKIILKIDRLLEGQHSSICKWHCVTLVDNWGQKLYLSVCSFKLFFYTTAVVRLQLRGIYPSPLGDTILFESWWRSFLGDKTYLNNSLWDWFQ